MKTSHQLAKELLALPDLPISVEMWCRETPVPKLVDHGEKEIMLCYERSREPNLDVLWKTPFILARQKVNKISEQAWMNWREGINK
jgi:hypothetical protein